MKQGYPMALAIALLVLFMGAFIGTTLYLFETGRIADALTGIYMVCVGFVAFWVYRWAKSRVR